MIAYEKTKFLAEVKEELKHLGMKYSELAAKCGIPQKRVTVLMQSKTKFKDDEIKTITEFLGIY